METQAIPAGRKQKGIPMKAQTIHSSDLSETLERFAELGRGWFGHPESEPPSRDGLEWFAGSEGRHLLELETGSKEALLPECSMVPLPDGRLLLEWRNETAVFAAEVDLDARSGMWSREDAETGNTQYGDADLRGSDGWGVIEEELKRTYKLI